MRDIPPPIPLNKQRVGRQLGRAQKGGIHGSHPTTCPFWMLPLQSMSYGSKLLMPLGAGFEGAPGGGFVALAMCARCTPAIWWPVLQASEISAA